MFRLIRLPAFTLVNRLREANLFKQEFYPGYIFIRGYLRISVILDE